MVENGVTKYRTGRINAEVGLPKVAQVCFWCRLIKWESGIRPYCAFTGEYLINPKEKMGDRCPIEWGDDTV